MLRPRPKSNRTMTVTAGRGNRWDAGATIRRRAWAALLAVSCALVIAIDSNAGEVPSAPILRFETGRHRAFIQSLALDERQQRLYTVSDDKTIRVWQLPELTPLAAYRIPIGAGYEGQLYTAALSPDGQTLAVAGWTGWQWDNKGTIYLLDAASGELKGRVGGFDEVVGPLAYSADGRYLALGLLGKQGLHVLQTSDYSEIAWDIDYQDKTIGLAFTPQGRIITTALDGYERLYDNDFRLIDRDKRGLAGARPFGARLSPDGSRIVVGFHDVAAVSVLSAENLALLYSVRFTELPDQTNLTTVAWSADGTALYAGGEYGGAGATPIYRIADMGRGRFERFAAAAARISQIGVLPGGDMLYVAEDPAIGILDPASGRRRAFVGPETADFREGQADFRVARDGTVVQFSYGRNTGKPGRYAVLEQNLRASNDDRTLAAPLLRAPGLTITNWKNTEQPALNGKVLPLDDYEIARSYAIAPDQRQVLLGTEWALRLYDQSGTQRWWVKLPATAWAVNVSGDGRYALAALGDGTIRWYRLPAGAEELALFPHRNRSEWIAWIPRGYYMSSPYGDNYIGWHINRGKEQSPDFYRAVQFERVLYRPDLVLAAFQSYGDKTRSLALFDVSQLASIAPPRIRFEAAQVEEQRRGYPVRNLKFKVERNSLPMKTFAIYVNNVPVTPRNQRRLGAGETGTFSRKLAVDLPGKLNNIRIEVFNDLAMGVMERRVAAAPAPDAKPPVGDLYLLAIGVNHFPELTRDVDLSYAAEDAEAMAATVQQAGRGYYKRVHTQILSDLAALKPAKAKIKEALELIQNARGEDTVMVFLASHGISAAAGNYYFVPRDAAADDVQSVLKGAVDAARPSLQSWLDFFDALRNAAGRRILIVDTCQAKNIEGRFDAGALIKRSAASQFSFVLASQGGEESQEYEPGNHGLITYALLAGLTGGSDPNHDGLLSVNEWFGQSAPLAERLRDKATGAQTPQLLTPAPLGEFPLLKPLARSAVEPAGDLHAAQ